jgi:hypothetical protein
LHKKLRTWHMVARLKVNLNIINKIPNFNSKVVFVQHRLELGTSSIRLFLVFFSFRIHSCFTLCLPIWKVVRLSYDYVRSLSFYLVSIAFFVHLLVLPPLLLIYF